jgi:hypothetical protein
MSLPDARISATAAIAPLFVKMLVMMCHDDGVGGKGRSEVVEIIEAALVNVRLKIPAKIYA